MEFGATSPIRNYQSPFDSSFKDPDISFGILIDIIELSHWKKIKPNSVYFCLLLDSHTTSPLHSSPKKPLVGRSQNLGTLERGRVPQGAVSGLNSELKPLKAMTVGRRSGFLFGSFRPIFRGGTVKLPGNMFFENPVLLLFIYCW